MWRGRAGWMPVKSLWTVNNTFKNQLCRWQKSCRSHCWPECKAACRQGGLQPLGTPVSAVSAPAAPAWTPSLGAPNPSSQGCSSRWHLAKQQLCVLPSSTFSVHLDRKKTWFFFKKKDRKATGMGCASHTLTAWVVILLSLLKNTFNKSLRSHDLHVCFLFVFPHQLNSCSPST